MAPAPSAPDARPPPGTRPAPPDARAAGKAQGQTDDGVATLGPGRRILVGLDYSETGRAAFDAALRLARDFSAELVLLHAFPRRLGLSPMFGDDAYRMMAEHQGELETEEAVRLSTEWAAEARAAGIDVRAVVRDGPPAAAIIEEAERVGAAMVVVGTHGRSGLSKLLLGSVAEEVVRGAGRPVLVVPRPS